MSITLTTVILFAIVSLNVSAGELAHRTEVSYGDGPRPTWAAPLQGATPAPAASAAPPASAASASPRGQTHKTEVSYGPSKVESPADKVDLPTATSTAIGGDAVKTEQVRLELLVSKEISKKNAEKVYSEAAPKGEHLYGAVTVWVELHQNGAVASLDVLRMPADGSHHDVVLEAMRILKNSAPYAISATAKPPKFTLTFLYRKGDKRFKMRILDEG